MKITENDGEVNIGTKETSKTLTPFLSWNRLRQEMEASAQKKDKKKLEQRQEIFKQNNFAIQCIEQRNKFRTLTAARSFSRKGEESKSPVDT